MQIKTIFITLFILMLTASTALAFGPGGGIPMTPPNAEVHRLMKKAIALTLIHHLQLNDEQKSKLKEILAPIQSDVKALKEAEDNFLNVVMKNRLAETIAKLEKGENPLPPSKETVALHASIRALKRGISEKGRSIMPQIMSVLTDKQKELFKTFNPKDVFEFKMDHHKMGLLRMPPEELVMHIRNMPDDDFNEIINRMNRRMENKSGHGKRGQQRMLRVKAVTDLMQDIRKMSDEEFNTKVESLKQTMRELMTKRRGKHDKGRGMGRHGGMKSPQDNKDMKDYFKTMIFFTESFYKAL